MTDRQAAEAAGLNPDSAAYTKSGLGRGPASHCRPYPLKALATGPHRCLVSPGAIRSRHQGPLLRKKGTRLPPCVELSFPKSSKTSNFIDFYKLVRSTPQNCHPDRKMAKWRACPERSRMGTRGSTHNCDSSSAKRPKSIEFYGVLQNQRDGEGRDLTALEHRTHSDRAKPYAPALTAENGPSLRLVDAEINLDIYFYRNGFSLQRRGLEFVLLHRFDGLLVQPHAQVANYLDPLRVVCRHTTYLSRGDAKNWKQHIQFSASVQ